MRKPFSPTLALHSAFQYIAARDFVQYNESANNPAPKKKQQKLALVDFFAETPCTSTSLYKVQADV